MPSDKFEKSVLDHLIELTRNHAEIKERLSGVESRLDSVEVIVVRIENDHGDKLRALFDARETQIDVNERMFKALNRIEEKVDRIELKVTAHDAVLKKVK